MNIGQIIDLKSNCLKVYYDKQFLNDIPNEMDGTWVYSSLLVKNTNIQIAKLYCGGKMLDEMCPISLKPQWKKINHKIKAFYTSLREAKTNYNEICIHSLIPEDTFKRYFELKNTICSNVFKNYQKPENYEFLVDLCKMLYEIGERRLNIEDERYPKHILYNMFGARHGRLTTSPGSFPILTLPKKDRGIVKPKNDFFLSLDYNSAELRTLNVLLGKENINEEDLHSWNIANIFKKSMSRDTAKKEFFAWLYNPAYKNEVFERHYDRNILLEKYFQNGKIINPFKRGIECDKDHAINYLVSSTLTDIFLRQSIKVNKLLENHNSFISFLVHDSLTIDCDNSEKETIKKAIDIFENTCYGIFRVSKKIGKNFGDLKEI